MNKAVIWDMDGVLVDSGAYHFQAWRDAMAREGIDFDQAAFLRTFGQRNDTILEILFGHPVDVATLARIGDAKEAQYRELVRSQGISLLSGVAAWLERLQAQGWRQAIGSAAPRANVEAIIDVLNIGQYIEAYTGAEDVRHGKPDPEVYLQAAAQLGVEPARCIVVEDAPAGIEGARRAGMACIGVLSSHGALNADLTTADMAQLPVDCFEQLIKGAEQ